MRTSTMGNDDILVAIAKSIGFKVNGSQGDTPFSIMFPVIMQEAETHPPGERDALYAAFGEYAGVDPEAAVQCLRDLVGPRLG